MECITSRWTCSLQPTPDILQAFKTADSFTNDQTWEHTWWDSMLHTGILLWWNVSLCAEVVARTKHQPFCICSTLQTHLPMTKLEITHAGTPCYTLACLLNGVYHFTLKLQLAASTKHSAFVQHCRLISQWYNLGPHMLGRNLRHLRAYKINDIALRFTCKSQQTQCTLQLCTVWHYFSIDQTWNFTCKDC